jgi:ATP-dependent Clp protease adaptor protein ClpS
MVSGMLSIDRTRDAAPSSPTRFTLDPEWNPGGWLCLDPTESGPLGPVQAGPPGSGAGDEPPSGPPPKQPVDPSRERDRSVATKERSKSARPPRFKVILYNDNYTPMEFVVQVLEKVFGKSPSAATQIMLQIHRSGMGVGGVYVLEVAETKSATVLRMAEERGYPLRSGVEKE